MTIHSDLTARFAPFAERMQREQMPEIVIENFKHYYGVLATGSTGLIAESSIEPVQEVAEYRSLERYSEAGLAALPKAVMLKLNGGLGTGMGLEKAKSLLVVRDKLSFLDIIIRQNLHLRNKHNCFIPLVLMNSFSTDDDTQEVLKEYPDLEGNIPSTFLQNKVPKVLANSLEPAEWPESPDLEWCPPGHGELYLSLVTTGLLDQLLAEGYEYLFVSNADNLGATLDPTILGYMASKGTPFLMEVAARTEADKKGGHIARRRADGQLLLREIAQCPDDDLDDFQDLSRHGYFNTNNIWINLPKLKQILIERNNMLQLPMIRNSKSLDPRDSSSPAVYQLETAMGAALEVFPGAEVLQVERSRFMPVKTCQDLLVVRSDIYSLDEQFHLALAPERSLAAPVVELDGRYFKLIDDFEQRIPEPPSLIDCAQLKVEGDVAFEPGLVLRGAVSILNSSDEQRKLKADAPLADQTLEL